MSIAFNLDSSCFNSGSRAAVTPGDTWGLVSQAIPWFQFSRGFLTKLPPVLANHMGGKALAGWVSSRIQVEPESLWVRAVV